MLLRAVVKIAFEDPTCVVGCGDETRPRRSQLDELSLRPSMQALVFEGEAGGGGHTFDLSRVTEQIVAMDEQRDRFHPRARAPS